MIPVDPCGAMMDWQRSCKETTMIFPGVGPVRVRWYWTDKPPLPFPTVYGSADWRADKPVDFDGDIPGFGEDLTYPRPQRNGKPPLPCDCDGPQGSPAAWLGLTGTPLYSCPGWGASYDLGYNDDYDSLTLAGG
jgi:hypothetical protein